MFFSKNKGPKVRDVMYLDDAACIKAVIKWLQEHPAGHIAIWFPGDMESFREKIGTIGEGRVQLAGRLSFSHETGREVLFIGHYPLYSVETALYNEQDIKEALIYSHLDMPLLASFGAANIKEMMIKMGMQPDEAIENPMITKAIRNALDKIAEKVMADMPARSEAEWMRLYGG